jgi:glycosyltransferase involved in cell wall biosynthesis
VKVKLLYVIGNIEFGGGERGFAQIINGLPAEKYEVFLASQPSEEFYRSIHNTEVHFIPLTFSKRTNPSLMPSIAKIIKRNSIDIVHGQGARAEFYARLANRLACRSNYLSTIQMPVEGFDVFWPKKLIYILLDRMSERFVDRFIVVSRALEEQLVKKHGISSDKISLVYNGVELDKFNRRKQKKTCLRKEFNIPPDSPLIGTVGRMVWQKGFEYLIRAAPMVLQSFPQTRFLMVGDGHLKNDLIDLASSLQIRDSFIFTGFLHDVYQILSELDVFVLPSLREGYPLIILEAMATSKPIISTAIDGITEQIEDGVNGILVPPKDSESLASAIINLLRDPSLSKRLGRKARERVTEQFSVEKMVAETRMVYQQVLEEKGLAFSC